MASKSTMDLESGQKVGPRRSRSLDSCLVLSVIVLFTALVSLAVAGLWMIHNLQSQLKHRPHQQFDPRSEDQLSSSSSASGAFKDGSSGPTDNTFKMQNFAYLEAKPSELSNHTMKWSEVVFLKGKSVGSNYEFSHVQHSLLVKEAGVYFLYVNLHLTCGGSCKAGHFRVRVHSQGSDKLLCDVDLPDPRLDLPHLQPQQKKCWTVTTLRANTTLLSEMVLPHGSLHHWELKAEHEASNGGSSFGIFLVGQ